MPPKGTNFMRIVPVAKAPPPTNREVFAEYESSAERHSVVTVVPAPEVSVKEPQCCEVFDRFCFGCREIKNLKAHQAYRERLRRLMVVPTPGEEEGLGSKIPDELVDLVSDADDDDDDDIAHDPEIRAMWARGEHTCTMFDAPCAVCEKDDEEDEEVDH